MLLSKSWEFVNIALGVGNGGWEHHRALHWYWYPVQGYTWVKMVMGTWEYMGIYGKMVRPIVVFGPGTFLILSLAGLSLNVDF